MNSTLLYTVKEIKIMKEYPKIFGVLNKDKCLNQPCIAFAKLDGSSLRFEWNSRYGWYKFGTRRRLFDKSDVEYGCAINIFLQKYADELESIVRINSKYKNVKNFIAYAEFFGPYSFAGKHDANFLNFSHNDPKDVVLFDINVYKKGFVNPKDFINDFGHLHIPQIIYEGNFTEEFIQDVRNGVYSVCEGVIAKGGVGHNIWFKKVKTLSYLKKIKDVFGTGWKDHWE